MDRSRLKKLLKMVVDDQDGFAWVNVSSGTVWNKGPYSGCCCCVGKIWKLLCQNNVAVSLCCLS